MTTALVLGGVLAILVPMTNGLATGYWFWSSWSAHLLDSFYIDLFWLLTGMSSIVIFFKNKFSKTTNSKFSE